MLILEPEFQEFINILETVQKDHAPDFEWHNSGSQNGHTLHCNGVQTFVPDRQTVAAMQGLLEVEFYTWKPCKNKRGHWVTRENSREGLYAVVKRTLNLYSYRDKEEDCFDLQKKFGDFMVYLREAVTKTNVLALEVEAKLAQKAKEDARLKAETEDREARIKALKEVLEEMPTPHGSTRTVSTHYGGVTVKEDYEHGTVTLEYAYQTDLSNPEVRRVGLENLRDVTPARLRRMLTEV